MDFPLDQSGRHSKNPPSSIQSRWTLKSIDLNIVVDLHISADKYLTPSWTWTIMGEERLSTIWEVDSVVIFQCRIGFGRSRRFWMKDRYDYVLPQHGNLCHPTSISIPQTVYQQQDCLPKEHPWGLVPCHHQPPDPDSLQGQCLLLKWRYWTFQPK